MEAINFTYEALDDHKFWQKSGNIIILKRVRQLLQAIEADPFTGIDEQEALIRNIVLFTSCRIT